MILSQDLNRAILRLAPKHTASDLAPDTFKRLMDSKVSGLVVWAGASDKTIYGDPSVNHAFRAWHDSLHLKLAADFSFEGELRVAREQARLLQSDRLGNIVMAEVEGQAAYLAKHGYFPLDQVGFITEYLKKGA